MFIKDSSGNRSLTATVALVSWIVVMIKVLLNGSSASVGSASYTFGTIDAATVGCILTSTLGTYLGRRWGDPVTAVEVPQDAGGKPGDGAK